MTDPVARALTRDQITAALDTATLMKITGEAIHVQDGCGLSVDGSLLRDRITDVVLAAQVYEAALVSLPAAPGLDVERLARAIDYVGTFRQDDIDWTKTRPKTPAELSIDIAREYAALK